MVKEIYIGNKLMTVAPSSVTDKEIEAMFRKKVRIVKKSDTKSIKDKIMAKLFR